MINDVSRPSRYRRPRSIQRRSRMLAAAAVLTLAGAVAFSGQAYGSGASRDMQIQVRPNDTLWAIAERAYGSSADIPERVNKIIDINHLDGAVIDAGEELTLPSR